jgi:flagellar assembly factor FliW
MTVNTKAYGSIELDERQRITFPRGLLGFEKYHDFALLNASQEPFFYLQSLEAAEIAFILIDPFLFRPDYELDVSDEELGVIGVKDQKDVLVFSLVTIPPTGGPMTANLMGPLVINRDSRQAAQVVLADPRWLTKHDIMRELAETRKSAC